MPTGYSTAYLCFHGQEGDAGRRKAGKHIVHCGEWRFGRTDTEVTKLHTSVSMGRKVTLGVAKQANTSCSMENGISIGLTKKLLSCILLFPWAGR
jgi:hypothetical protein